MVHTRSRYADVVRISKEPVLDVDGEGAGYVHTSAASEHMKSGQTRKRRRREVPVAGLARGLLGGPWAQKWLAARKAEGLEAAADGTLFPAKSRQGWTRASADIAEANATLLEFLIERGLGAAEASECGTHSCKATLLSWCAKGGVKSEHRRLLGGHARPKERQVLEYSRDDLAAPLLQLDLLLTKIRDGEFDPDADRSGRWAEAEGVFARFGILVSWAGGPGSGTGGVSSTHDAGDANGTEGGGVSSTHDAAPPRRAQGDGGSGCTRDARAPMEPRDSRSNSKSSSDVSLDEVSRGSDPPEEVPELEDDRVDEAAAGLGRSLYVHTRLRRLHTTKLGDVNDEFERLACGTPKARCTKVTTAYLADTDCRGVCERCFAKLP